MVDKIRAFHNHPGFVEAVTDRLKAALAKIPEGRRNAARLIYTAHSIPTSMAQGCDYEKQLLDTARTVAERLGHNNWRLVFQSRSGPDAQRWLEPDVLDCLRELKGSSGSADVVIAPIGFVSDHMEILFDLDVQAHQLCQELGLNMVRAETVGTHPRFIRMIRELICERIDEAQPRLSLGALGVRPDFCPLDCCLMPRRPSPGA